MSEVSKEAMQRARGLLGPDAADACYLESWATALQELMDERDEEAASALRMAHNLADRIEEREAERKRAEKAEEQLCVAVDEYAKEMAAQCALTVQQCERAEKAEARLRDIYEGNEPNPIGLAEAKLAELVRRVREHAEKSVLGVNSVLLDILAEFEAKP